jgi:hypothetical protein
MTPHCGQGSGEYRLLRLPGRFRRYWGFIHWQSSSSFVTQVEATRLADDDGWNVIVSIEQMFDWEPLQSNTCYVKAEGNEKVCGAVCVFGVE